MLSVGFEPKTPALMVKVSIGLGAQARTPKYLRLQQNFQISPLSSNLNRNCIHFDCTQLFISTCTTLLKSNKLKYSS